MLNAILIYVIPAIAALAVLGWRLRARTITHGSAKWLLPWEASAAGLFRRRGLLVGDWTKLLPVYGGQDGHALTVAPTGRGKGTCAIIPNLLSQRFIFLIDPGGENTAVAIKTWRAKGYDVQVLNPWGMHAQTPWELPAHRFNPLVILDPQHADFASDASLMAEMLITRSKGDSGNTSYFKDEAQSGLRALLMHLATTEPAARCHLGTLRNWIMLGGAPWDALIASMIRNKAAGGLIAREAEQFRRRQEQAPEEFSAIVSTMKQDTNFLDDPVMRAALAANDADFAALKGSLRGKPVKGAVVAVVIPLPYLRTHAAYARLAIAAALWQMQRTPVARERVLFVLDEFSALGRMDRIANGLAELRKYKVWLWPIIQDLSQLKALYDKSWATFLSNAAIKQWFGTADLETANYVSACCGDETVLTQNPNGPGGYTRRRLVTPDEVQFLPVTRQIAMIGNLRPANIRLTPYWERPEFAGRFNPNPYAANTPVLPPTTLLRVVWGGFVRLAAAVLEPAPVLVYAAAITAASYLHPAVLEAEYRDPRERAIVCEYRGVIGLERRFIYQPPRGQGRFCPTFKVKETYL